MGAKLILAVSGVRHTEDGSLSLLKAFIGGLAHVRFPASFRGSLALALESGPSDAGRRIVELRGMDADGADIISRRRLAVELSRAGDRVTLLLAVRPEFRRPGDYAFVVMIDGAERDRCTLAVRRRGSTEG